MSTNVKMCVPESKTPTVGITLKSVHADGPEQSSYHHSSPLFGCLFPQDVCPRICDERP